MFKLMRACIMVERPEDLWYFNPEVDILYYPDGAGIDAFNTKESENGEGDEGQLGKTFALTHLAL